MDWFGFEASRQQREVMAFYGPAYEPIKRFEQERRDFERLRIQTAPERVDEVAHQIHGLMHTARV